MEFENSVSILPLGGLGEFGMNMMVVQCGDDMVVIDAGMMFPESNMLGVDFVLPDVSYLVENQDKIRGVVITHAHEDHVGGLANLLQRIDVPVYGTKLSLSLAKTRLQEWGVLSKADLREIDHTASLDFGQLTVEFVRVAHSFPGTLGIVLRTPIGTIVHTGDFKLDHTPVGDDMLDVARLSALGNEGVLLLMSDSTNAEVPGYAPSEKSITPRLEQLFQTARKRMFVSTFASSLYRIQQFIELAAQRGRYVAVTGRSMVHNTKVASELGVLWMPPNLTIDIKDVGNLPPEKVLVLTTGTQGEPLSALSLIARGNHARLSIEEGDTVLISARIIPGNEKDITNLVNNLYRRGAEVYYGGHSAGIHASGHGFREDLKMMLSLTRPKFFIPIHGEFRQLTQHKRIAEEMGVSSKNILIVEDGQRVRLTKDVCEIEETIEIGRVLVDGKHMDVEEIVLRDRRLLSEDGMVIAIIALDKETRALKGEPDFVSRGFIHVDESTELIDEAKALIKVTIESLTVDERRDLEKSQEAVRVGLRRFFTKRTDRRPLILPVIIEV